MGYTVYMKNNLQRPFKQFKAKKIKQKNQHFWKVSMKCDNEVAHLSPVTTRPINVKIFINIELNTQTGVVTQF